MVLGTKRPGAPAHPSGSQKVNKLLSRRILLLVLNPTHAPLSTRASQHTHLATWYPTHRPTHPPASHDSLHGYPFQGVTPASSASRYSLPRHYRPGLFHTPRQPWQAQWSQHTTRTRRNKSTTVTCRLRRRQWTRPPSARSPPSPTCSGLRTKDRPLPRRRPSRSSNNNSSSSPNV